MKKLLATLLILCAGPVWAEWINFAGDDEFQFYYDPSAIRGKSIKRVWMRTERTTRDDQGTMSSRVLIAFDCQEGRSRYLQVETFSESGLKNQLQAFQVPEEWAYIPPNTVKEGLFELVCRKK